jgi:hypothetical protein
MGCRWEAEVRPRIRAYSDCLISATDTADAYQHWCIEQESKLIFCGNPPPRIRGADCRQYSDASMIVIAKPGMPYAGAKHSSRRNHQGAATRNRIEQDTVSLILP